MVASIMLKKPLIETNPYLKDPVQRKSLLDISVSSSTAIEGVRIVFPQPPKTQAPDKSPTLNEPEGSYGSRR